MKKQGFNNHKKPRKLLDQVRDFMRFKYIICLVAYPAGRIGGPKEVPHLARRLERFRCGHFLEDSHLIWMCIRRGSGGQGQRA